MWSKGGGAARAAAFVDRSARISVVQMRYHSRELGGCLPASLPAAACGFWSSVRVHLSAAGQ